MRLTVGLCIRWRAVNNGLGGVCAAKEGKVEQLFRKTPWQGIPCRACVWCGRKGRVRRENRGKCWMRLTDLSPGVPVWGQDVCLQAVAAATERALCVWCVVTNVPLEGAPPAEMLLFGREQHEVEQASDPSPSPSLGRVTLTEWTVGSVQWSSSFSSGRLCFCLFVHILYLLRIIFSQFV